MSADTSRSSGEKDAFCEIRHGSLEEAEVAWDALRSRLDKAEKALKEAIGVFVAYQTTMLKNKRWHEILEMCQDALKFASGEGGGNG